MIKAVKWALLVAVTASAAFILSAFLFEVVVLHAVGDVSPQEEKYIKKTYKDIQIIDVSPATRAPLEALPEPETPEVPVVEVPDYAAELIGRTIWGEAGGVMSKAERAAVAWCILNRADARGQSIYEVVTASSQFHGYRPEGVCPQEHIDLAVDVLSRWAAEKAGASDVGRTLPAEYLYFWGDGRRNHFTVEYRDKKNWDWSLEDPYL